MHSKGNPQGASLLAVLLNPVPHKRPTMSARNVELAAKAVACTNVAIMNLTDHATVDLPTLCREGRDSGMWHRTRPQLQAAVEQADRLLFGWGLGLSGAAHKNLEAQVEWLVAAAISAGHDATFMLDCEPRHPSRWRQYLGPHHGRYASGETFEERLRLALKPTPLTAFATCRRT